MKKGTHNAKMEQDVGGASIGGIPRRVPRGGIEEVAVLKVVRLTHHLVHLEEQLVIGQPGQVIQKLNSITSGDIKETGGLEVKVRKLPEFLLGLISYSFLTRGCPGRS